MIGPCRCCPLRVVPCIPNQVTGKISSLFFSVLGCQTDSTVSVSLLHFSLIRVFWQETILFSLQCECSLKFPLLVLLCMYGLSILPERERVSDYFFYHQLGSIIIQGINEFTQATSVKFGGWSKRSAFLDKNHFTVHQAQHIFFICTYSNMFRLIRQPSLSCTHKIKFIALIMLI